MDGPEAKDLAKHKGENSSDHPRGEEKLPLVARFSTVVCGVNVQAVSKLKT